MAWDPKAFKCILAGWRSSENQISECFECKNQLATGFARWINPFEKSRIKPDG